MALSYFHTKLVWSPPSAMMTLTTPCLNAPMPVLTRRRDPHRPDSWRVRYGDVHVGTVAKPVGNPSAVES
jgi:hypothetical protein